MSTDEERAAELPIAEEILLDASGGNKDAEEYLRMIAGITRTLDDVYDEDRPVTREKLLGIFETLFVKLPTNKFFQKHRDLLLSQHITMYGTWMASNIFTNYETEQIYAHVWRDYVDELLPIVALLTQGYDKMIKVSIGMRLPFMKKLGE